MSRNHAARVLVASRARSTILAQHARDAGLEVRLARDTTEALAMLDHIDGALSDEIDLLVALRAHTGKPLVLVADHDVHALLNRAARAAVLALAAPIVREDLAAIAAQLRPRAWLADVLTPRELACVERRLERKTYKEIASLYRISPATVATYLRRALARLGLRSFDELATALA